MPPKLPLALSSNVCMYEEMPNFAVGVIDAFLGKPWADVEKILKLVYPKNSKERRRRILTKMMKEIEDDGYLLSYAPGCVDLATSNDAEYNRVINAYEQAALERYFPTWSTVHDDIDTLHPDGYHAFVQANL